MSHGHEHTSPEHTNPEHTNPETGGRDVSGPGAAEPTAGGATPAGGAAGGAAGPTAGAPAAGGAAGDPGDADADADEAALRVEEDLDLVAQAIRERDGYLDDLRRLQADFENYKKRMIKQQSEHLERAAESLVDKLLPVLDTADLALVHGGGEEVKQVWTALFDALERQGLQRIDAAGAPFDPTVHDAVAHEPVEGSAAPEVAEVLRAGYLWKGRVLRPAMVKVRG